MGVELAPVLTQELRQVSDECGEGRSRTGHTRHDLDGLTLLGSDTGNAVDHALSVSDHEDQLVLGIHLAAVPPRIAGEKRLDPALVHTLEVLRELIEDELAHLHTVELSVERHDRQVLAVELPSLDLSEEDLVDHHLGDARLVVALGLPRTGVALAHEEVESPSVLACHGSVHLARTVFASVVLHVLQELGAEAALALSLRGDDQRTDLPRPLPLADDVHHGRGFTRVFQNEHHLLLGKVTEPISTFQVAIENSGCMGPVIAVVVRRQCVIHQVGNEEPVALHCRTNDGGCHEVTSQA